MPPPSLSPEAGRRSWSQLAVAVLSRPVTHALMGAMVLLADILTGPFLRFPVLFVVPVSLAGWYCGRRSSLLLAVLLPVGGACIEMFHEAFPHQPFAALNAAIRIAVLVFIAYLVSRTAAQTRILALKVKQLEGLLPICMFCKRIRDEGNSWQQLEAYISTRSEARFSHGLCPVCAREHYGIDLDAPPRD